MATVGNLFVNIRGDATHLEKTVKKSKGTLAKFASQANLIGDAFRKTRIAFRDERQLAKMQGQRRSAMRLLQRTPESTGIGRFMQANPPTPQAIEAQRAGVRKTGVAAKAAQMRLAVGGALAVLGVSIAAVSLLLSKASKVQNQTEEDFMAFTARGAALKNQMLMDRINYVQRADIQEQQADVVETERLQLSREREAFGEVGAAARDFGQEMRRAFSDVFQALKDTGAF